MANPINFKAAYQRLPSRVRGDTLLRSDLAVFVDHWGMDYYEPQERTVSVVRQIIQIVLGMADADNLQTLQETPAAASTASDDLVKEIGQSMDVQYAIGSIINNEGSSFTGRGERMDRLVRAVLSSPPVREIVEALVGLMRATSTMSLTEHPTGVPWQTAVLEARKPARSILSRFQSVGGEKHDHADGTSAEVVEKVTQVDERRQ